MKQKGFYFDMGNCIECKSCQIACKDKNNLADDILYRKVESFEGGSFPNPWVYFLSSSCNHCQKPVCVEKCPTGACTKRKEDGIVFIQTEKCVGCRQCVKNCPFGAPKYLGKDVGKSGKCNGCIDLDLGELPACVAACNMRVLELDDVNSLKKKYSKAVQISSPSGVKSTKPSTLIKVKECAKGKV